MITRRNTLVLAAVTAFCFLVAAVIGNHSHGVPQAIANVAWFGFLLGALLLVVVGVARLARWFAARARAAAAR
jgi:MFS superfamily sulfate permease-like transporter